MMHHTIDDDHGGDNGVGDHGGGVVDDGGDVGDDHRDPLHALSPLLLFISLEYFIQQIFLNAERERLQGLNNFFISFEYFIKQISK